MDGGTLEVSHDVSGTVFRQEFPPITRHTLALFCGASGDHNPIHVDLDFARASGFDDVFAHGMLAMAFLGRALSETVPAEALKSFSCRFVAVTQLGARITSVGEVESAADDEVTLALTAIDQHGDVKLRGQAIVDKARWRGAP